ncbi:MAG: EAL domain-containing protein [Proteobacteria bacterium]|nr:EAL domain-containing protein [Pseudomonadota bacterium]
MFRVLTCLAVEHNWWLVALAAAVCITSSYSVIDIGRHARAAKGLARLYWIAAAAMASGFGIWATHFVAMLAYDPGVVIGYDTGLTLLSLVVAVLVTAAGLAVAILVRQRWAVAAGGGIVGLGVASMHYLGMAAVQIPGRIEWAADLVVASIVLGAALAAAALMAARRRQDLTGALHGTVLLTLAICSLHFTGMGAITILPDPATPVADSILAPERLAVGISIAAGILLGLGLFSMVMSRRARATQSARARLFRILVEGVTDYAIYLLNPDGTVANWNEGARRAKGYTADEIVGKHFACFHTERDRAAGKPQKALETALAEGRFEGEGWRLRKDGSRFWAHVVIDPIRDDMGKLIGFAKITRDVTTQRADRLRIEETGRRLDLALSNMSQGLCLFDRKQELALFNGRLAEIFGLPEGHFTNGMSFEQFLTAIAGSRDRARAMQDRHGALVEQAEPSMVTEEFGEGRVVAFSHRPIGDGSWVTTCEDVTERRRSEARIAHMARHDALTGLPNRVAFNDHLGAAMADAKPGEKVAVFGIDLNRFKEINDLRGHAVGDTVLKTLSQRMSEMLQAGEFVARFGGDEFSAVKVFSDRDDLMDFAQRMEACLFGRMVVDDFEIAPGASMGVALFPDDALEHDQLVSNADLAMYRAKASISHTVCFYEARMDEAVRTRRSLAKELWEGIEAGQFSLYYQVQKSVSTGETTGYEVLLRWHHPKRGLISPADFIPIAEECGAILPLGEWALRTACEEAVRWPRPYKIAVNLSPVQISHGDFIAILTSALERSGLDATRLELEITESTIIADKERALHMLRRIKALGVTVAIDDFGTGYSSLETLRAFPFDKIKLDRTFMTEVETSQQAKAIIRAILALGRSLEVPVLAEGVETADQLALLAREGCDEAQGYLLGRPRPHSAIKELKEAAAAPPLVPAIDAALEARQAAAG